MWTIDIKELGKLENRISIREFIKSGIEVGKAKRKANVTGLRPELVMRFESEDNLDKVIDEFFCDMALTHSFINWYFAEVIIWHKNRKLIKIRRHKNKKLMKSFLNRKLIKITWED